MYSNAGLRLKLFSVPEVCGDCGATDPGWASLNRGILLCNDCCSIHRSLGRHMSQVKSLRKAHWSASLLAMVRALSGSGGSGANGIWEHTLLDPSSNKCQRKKPHWRDPIHPNKAEFIKAKHQMLLFVHRPTKEDTQGQDGDVSRQLHSSVRTANLEISLRLLSLGADPNYFHPEKGNCALHVAAKCGHSSQVEMLVIYGGDPGIEDSHGLTPTDYARDAGHLELGNRLTELQYEVTDSFSLFTSGRKPDHAAGEHWLVPSENDGWSEEAKSKLLSLPNHLFEELVCDVYDEIDRRETDVVWFESFRDETSPACAVPFLPVNPEFSSTRNQGRQKLARLNSVEFKSLVCDVLLEVKRRADGIVLSHLSAGKLVPSSVQELSTHIGHPKHLNINNSSTRPHSNNALNRNAVTASSPLPSNTVVLDEEPLYDSVASEDDYSSLERRQKIQNHLQFLKRQKASIKEDYQEVNLPHIDEPSSMAAWMGIWKKESGNGAPIAAAVSIEEYIEMKRQLDVSQAKIKDLQDNNIHMKTKLQELSSAVMNLKEENETLKCSSSKLTDSNFSPISPQIVYSHMIPVPTDKNGECVSPIYQGSGCSRQQRPYSMFETRSPPGSPLRPVHSNTSHVESFYSNNSYENLKNGDENASQQSTVVMPTQEEVVHKTEVITRRIQELLRAAQDSRHEHCIPCAEQISFAVKDMADLFPKGDCSTELLHAVRQLVTSSNRLLSECRNHIASQLHTLDPGLVSQYVIQCAYDIAKAAKIVVTQFQ